MSKENKIQIFDKKQVRTHWDEEQEKWYFSVVKMLKDFFYFLKSPTDTQNSVQTKSHKAKILLLLLIIDIPLMGLISIIISLFDKLGLLKIEYHQLNLLIEFLPIWLVLILSIIIIPFFEEIIFRLPLRFNRNYILLAIIKIFNREDNKTKNKLLNYWNKKYLFVFYLFSLLFALIHISNYDTQSTVIYIFPILILPQFILALFIGYLRVRYNFTLGYLMHSLHNTFFVTITLLSLTTSTLMLNLNNNDYSLKIEEITKTNNSIISLAQDSIKFQGIELKTIVSALTNTDRSLINGSEHLLRKKINLDYIQKSNTDLNNDSIILHNLSDIYKFKLEHKQKRQKVYSLFINDTSLLSKHYSHINDESITSTISAKDITIKNMTIAQLSRELSYNYKIQFESQANFPNTLNATLPNSNLSELLNVLKNDYGIHTKEIYKTIEYLYLEEHGK